MKTLALFATAALLAAAGSATAGGATAAIATPHTPVSKTDKSFVQQAALSGMAEIATGQIAAVKGTKYDVKQFGRQMVRDHAQADNQLKQIAATDGLSIPTSDPKAKKETEKLNKLSGDAFDQQYTLIQLTDHDKAIQLFQNEANSGQNTQLKQFASDTLPILEGHLQVAQGMAAVVGVKEPSM